MNGPPLPRGGSSTGRSKHLREVDPALPKNPPCLLAAECAIAIAEYCLTRFPCDQPPHQMIDVPYFAEKVQRCIDEATTIGLGLKRELQKADETLTVALALTDTGSTEFRKAFPPQSAGESLNPREMVPGWRVVEKIREVLLCGATVTKVP